jgi:hypothetical protein
VLLSTPLHASSNFTVSVQLANKRGFTKRKLQKWARNAGKTAHFNWAVTYCSFLHHSGQDTPLGLSSAGAQGCRPCSCTETGLADMLHYDISPHSRRFHQGSPCPHHKPRTGGYRWCDLHTQTHGVSSEMNEWDGLNNPRKQQSIHHVLCTARHWSYSRSDMTFQNTPLRLSHRGSRDHRHSAILMWCTHFLSSWTPSPDHMACLDNLSRRSCRHSRHPGHTPSVSVCTCHWCK